MLHRESTVNICPLEYSVGADHCMYMKKPPRLGEKYTQGLVGAPSDTHTGPGIVCVPTGQTEKSNSQKTTESTVRVLPQTKVIPKGY